jgi:hypothetical protein
MTVYESGLTDRKEDIMAYSINHNSADTTGRTADITINLFSKSSNDYTVVSQGTRPASTTVSNLDSGISTPELTNMQFSRVPNIYLNSEIERVLQAPSKQGLKVYRNLKQTWSYTDSEGVQPSYNKPVQGSISLSIPNDGVVTVTDVYQFLQDLVATFWWDGQLRLEKELRGSTNPLSD